MIPKFELNYWNSVNIVLINLERATAENAENFGEFLEDVNKFNGKNILFDFSPCQYVDSTFLGMLVRNYIKLKKAGYNVKISCNDKVSFIMCEVSKLSSVIDIYKNPNEALKNF